MKLFIKKVAGFSEELLPKRASKTDAGYDIVATSEPNIVFDQDAGVLDLALEGIKAFGRVLYVEYGTNLFVTPAAIGKTITKEMRIPDLHNHLEIFPRSSISKYNLVLANSVGTVDTGYQGEIKVRFKYITQPCDLVLVPEYGGNRFYGRVNKEFIYRKGDKIAQLKARYNEAISFEVVDELPSVDERGAGGFGSSGN